MRVGVGDDLEFMNPLCFSNHKRALIISYKERHVYMLGSDSSFPLIYVFFSDPTDSNREPSVVFLETRGIRRHAYTFFQANHIHSF